MEIENIFEITAIKLQEHFSHGIALFGDPNVVTTPYLLIRYALQSDALASMLKMARLISGINAGNTLLRSGYFQELGVICRTLDDYFFEILFIMEHQSDGSLSENQKKFLEDFFKEELDKPLNPFSSNQKRDRVPQKTIIAAYARLTGQYSNESDCRELARTLQQTYSGYVHGAYPHIMEMCSMPPATYHLQGMRDTPRLKEWQSQLSVSVYRTIMIFVMICQRYGFKSNEDALRNVLKWYEEETGIKSETPLKELMKKVKKGIDPAAE